MHNQHRRKYLERVRYDEDRLNKKMKVGETSQESLADLGRPLTNEEEDVVYWLRGGGFKKKTVKKLRGLGWEELLNLDRNALIEKGIAKEHMDNLLDFFEKLNGLLTPYSCGTSADYHHRSFRKKYSSYEM